MKRAAARETFVRFGLWSTAGGSTQHENINKTNVGIYLRARDNVRVLTRHASRSISISLALVRLPYRLARTDYART